MIVNIRITLFKKLTSPHTGTLLYILIFFLIVFTNRIYAQNTLKHRITGTVTDTASGIPLQYVSVALYNSGDSSLINGTITDSKGEYSLTLLQEGRFFLRFSFVGYTTKSLEVILDQTTPTRHDTIFLHHNSQYLDAVTVTTNQVDRLVNFDMQRINIEQSQGAITGSLADVLRDQPNITIDAENRLYLRGNPNILLLIDGRPASLDMIGALPASVAASIEIITNPNVKYEAEGTGGIINIVMKKESRRGITGSVSANYGIMNRFNTGVNLSITGYNAGINIYYNHRNERDEVTGSLIRALKADSTEVLQDILSQQSARTNTAGFLFSASHGSKHLFSAGSRFSTPSFHNVQQLFVRQFHDTSLLLSYHRLNDVHFSRKMSDNSISYKRVFQPGKHELSFDGMFTKIKGSRPADYYMEEHLAARSEGGGAPSLATLQADYLRSTGGGGKLEGGVRYFYRWNNFNYSFFDFDTTSSKWIKNAIFSNDLEHSEMIYSGYLMYSDSLFRILQYKAGFRLEYNTSELLQISTEDTILSSEWFPFPFFMLNYQINRAHRIAFSFNRRVTRPTYPQLNPWISVVDPLTYETGNKYLKPEILDKAELGHLYTGSRLRINSNLFISSTNNYITQVSLLDSADKLVVTYVNAEKELRYGLEADCRYDLNTKLTINGAFALFRQSAEGIYQSVNLAAEGVSYNGNLRVMYKPFRQTTLQFSGNYNSPVALPQFNLDHIYYFDLSVRHTLLKNQLTLNFLITDITSSRQWLITSNNDIFRLENFSRSRTRVFWIGITYNMNHHRPAPARGLPEPEPDRSRIRIGQ